MQKEGDHMYAAGSLMAKKEYVICLYIRLSMEDGDVPGNLSKKESGSITTQRALLCDYIKSRTELTAARSLRNVTMVFPAHASTIDHSSRK